MKETLQDFKLMLVYVLEFVVNCKQRSLTLIPIDAANGVIMEETREGSGTMRGLLVSGGEFKIPAAAITNVFASWWKCTERTNRGVDNYYVDDAVVERKVERAVDDPKKWDDDGCLKDVKGRDQLPKDVRNSRIVRGG